MATSAPVSVETCIIETVIRGYHIYKEIWAASIGEVLLCARETANVHDPYAVAVIRRSITVGHVPRALSAVCSLFIRRSGEITCQVTGSKKYSTDLPQGGLEIPCKLIFKGEKKLVSKVSKLLKEALTSGLVSVPTKEEDSEHKLADPPKTKVKKASTQDATPWIQFDGMTLTHLDKIDLRDGKWLNDKHINFAQHLLKKQFPLVGGWKKTFLLSSLHLQQRFKIGIQLFTLAAITGLLHPQLDVVKVRSNFTIHFTNQFMTTQEAWS